MKKSFISLGLIAATVLSLTNCTKEIENPAQEPESAGIPFEIVASTPDTKTTNDGLATNWAANDQISVFHALTGVEEYVNDGPFIITSENLGAKKFTGTLGGDGLDGEASYDWYVMYPYKSAWKPNTTSGGVVYMGSKYNEVQTQNGNDSKAHLDGDNVPFAGKAIDVAASDDVDVAMEHLAAVLEITVNNTSGEPLTVSSVTFTAPEPIIGGYYISIVGAEPVYTPNGSYVNETATLTVKNGDAIASGSSAKFYLAVKPFSVSNGDELRVSINGYEKTLPISKDVRFDAGKIKPLTFKYDKIIAQEIPYFESFNNTQGLFAADNKSLADGLSYVWKTNSGYIKASAYAGENYAAESWLVSPYMDLTTAASAYLSFEHYGDYFTNIDAMKEEVKVKVRKQGGEWSDLAVEYPASLKSYAHSGYVSLESYLGNNVQIAFAYTSDTKAGTWQIRNFKVDIKKDQFLSFSADEVEAKIGEDFVVPNLSGAETTVVYTSSNTDVATVNESTGEVSLVAAGETTITATASETSEYFEDSATYVLTVKAADDNSKTYTWTVSKSDFGTGTTGYSGSNTINEVLWNIERTLMATVGFTGNSLSNGYLQIGKKDGAENMTISTSSITGVIKTVSVDCAAYQGKHSLNITVGGVSYLTEAMPTWSSNTGGILTGNGSSSGEVVISFTGGDGARAMYVKSITIVYE